MATARRVLSIAFVGIVLSIHSYARDFFVTDDMGAEEYDALHFSIRRGDSLHFPNGTRFIIGDLLGSGENTWVFQLVDPPNRVIRLPKKFDRRTYINEFVSGARDLARLGAPVVTVHDYLPDHYAVVDLLEAERVSLQDFLRGVHLFGPQEEEQALTSLREFIVRTAMIADVGDLYMDNLVYEPRQNRWIVMDLTAQVTMADTRNNFSGSIVTKLFDPEVFYHDEFLSFSNFQVPIDEELLQRIRNEMIRAVVVERSRIRSGCRVIDWNRLSKRT